MCKTPGDLLHRHELTLQLNGESADLLGAELEGGTLAVNIEDLVAATLQHSQPLSYLASASAACVLSAFHEAALHISSVHIKGVHAQFVPISND